MEVRPKHTTTAACRVVGFDRDRFNEHVASGHYPCAPNTVPGRMRLFDPDNMVAYRIFRDLLQDGASKERAGKIACAVVDCTRMNPEAGEIAFIQTGHV